jgi:hypothetical protein
MKLNLAEWLVIGFCAVLLIGYIIGFYYNRQQAGKIHGWLRANLEKWGPVALGERLPGMVTGGRLLVQNSAAPFRQIEAVYLLAPRENLVFWLFHLLQGRGDELILRIHLPKVPRQALEVKRTWLSRLTYQGEAAQQMCESFMARHGRSLIHLAFRREAPHFFVRARLPALMADSSGEFFTSVAELVS